jgi:hypothetical protein
MGANRDYKVDMLVNMLGSERVPRNVFSIVSHANRKKLPNIGVVAFVMNESFARNIGNIIARMVPLKGTYKLVATLDEAEALIAKNQESGHSA